MTVTTALYQCVLPCLRRVGLAAACLMVAACGGGSGTTADQANSPTTTILATDNSSTASSTSPVNPPTGALIAPESSSGSIAFGNKTYLAVYRDGFATSADGRHWSDPISLGVKFSQVIWDGQRFVAVGANGAIATSATGSTWAVRTVSQGMDFLSLRKVDGRLVAHGVAQGQTAGGAPAVVALSTDAAAWTVQALPTNTQDVVAGNGQLVAGFSGGNLWASKDGASWTPATMPDAERPKNAPNRLLTALAFGGGQFVALIEYRDELAGMVAYAIWNSADGISWKSRLLEAVSDRAGRLNAIAHDGRQFIAVGSHGRIFTSPTGEGWTRRTSGTEQHLYTVAVVPQRLLAAGALGTLLTSSDGVTWQAIPTDVSNGLVEIRHAGSTLYALMTGGLDYTQTNFQDSYSLRRANANLVSINGTRWLRGPAQAGQSWMSQADSVVEPVTAFAGELTVLPNEGSTVAAPDGTLYVSDPVRHLILKRTADGSWIPFAGRSGIYGTKDGKGDDALFTNPGPMTVDSAGVLYIADGLFTTPWPDVRFMNRSAIRKVLPDGSVTTLAGATAFGNDPAIRGNVDGAGNAARFDIVSGLAVGANGDLYASDSQQHTIRRITSTGLVTTVAGKPGVRGNTDGPGTAATFYAPMYLQADAAGELFVFSSNTSESGWLRKLDTSGQVSTVSSLLATEMTMERSSGTLYFMWLGTLYRLDGGGQTALWSDGSLKYVPKSVTMVGGGSIAVFALGRMSFIPVK